MEHKIIDAKRLMTLVEEQCGDQHYISFSKLQLVIGMLPWANNGLTDRQRAIIMAYTGATMLVGDKLSIFYGYAEEKLGRPVFTHELAYIEVQEELKDAARDDFLALCSGTK